VELALVAAEAADAPVAAEVVFAALPAAGVVFVPLPFPSSLYTSMKSPTIKNKNKPNKKPFSIEGQNEGDFNVTNRLCDTFFIGYRIARYR
jgi:hypothetical protein